MLEAALVGTGHIAQQKHFPAWANASGADLVAVCDLDAEAAQAAAEKHGIPNAHSDLEAMLEEQQPDIVDLCTPPVTHADLGVQILEGGSHLLVEKPMAVDTEGCDRIIEAAEANDRRASVIHSDLFYPAFRRARQRVEDGEIGEFRGMHIFLSTPTDYMTSDPDHWANDLPGGVIGESGPHVVYLALAFINPIRGVQAHGFNLLKEYDWSPYEDYRLVMQGDSAVASATLTYATDHWAAEVELWGTDGIIKVDLESQTVVNHDRPELDAATVGRSALSDIGDRTASVFREGLNHLSGKTRSTHEVMIERFCRSIEDGTEVPVPLGEGREAVRVMNDITDQLETT